MGTVAVLTEAILSLMGKPDHEVRVIGTRHGEKLYEALLSREERAAAEDLEGFACAVTRHALIVPAGHPLARARNITLERIAEHPLVLPRKGLQHRRMVDEAFREAGLDYSAALETEGWQVMKHYVALGFGIAVVNDLCLAHSVPPQIVSRPLVDIFPERVYRAIWVRKRRLPEAARRYLELLRERASEHGVPAGART